MNALHKCKIVVSGFDQASQQPSLVLPRRSFHFFKSLEKLRIRTCEFATPKSRRKRPRLRLLIGNGCYDAPKSGAASHGSHPHKVGQGATCPCTPSNFTPLLFFRSDCAAGKATTRPSAAHQRSSSRGGRVASTGRDGLVASSRPRHWTIYFGCRGEPPLAAKCCFGLVGAATGAPAGSPYRPDGSSAQTSRSRACRAACSRHCAWPRAASRAGYRRQRARDANGRCGRAQTRAGPRSARCRSRAGPACTSRRGERC